MKSLLAANLRKFCPAKILSRENFSPYGSYCSCYSYRRSISSPMQTEYETTRLPFSESGLSAPLSCICVASFPGRSRLQFLIACSIKTEGEGLGERVTCVTSGRREGRHEGGRCPTKNLEVLLVISCPRT